VEKKAEAWEITAPKPLPVDQDAMNSMISSLASLTSDHLIEEKAEDLSAFGLTKPSVEIIVTLADGQTRNVLIGDETPTGYSYFAGLRGDPRVFTIASYTKSNIDKTSNDLRDKRLLKFDSDKLTRVELDAKGQVLEFGKNNQNEWQILKPRPLRADGGMVEELIRNLRDARMDLSFPEEELKKAPSAFASATRVAVARVTDASGTQELQVRRDKDNNYYARSSAVEGVYRIASYVGDALDKRLEDFRNKKVFDFGWNDPTKVEVRDGDKHTVYEKSGDKWMSAGKQMDSASVHTVIDKLRDLSAERFPEKGFGTPSLEFVVTSNEGKRVEKVLIAKSGDEWIARRENEPSLYQLAASAVEELQKALSEVKEAAPEKK
ncbi:MAG TPA: DUF4340 domain-containing protein, partial [Bryobacteraceae bacterium]|nr:DUF4340 domain-containing protein [Bryobacteraceae bacterium]